MSRGNSTRPGTPKEAISEQPFSANTNMKTDRDNHIFVNMPPPQQPSQFRQILPQSYNQIRELDQMAQRIIASAQSVEEIRANRELGEIGDAIATVAYGDPYIGPNLRWLAKQPEFLGGCWHGDIASLFPNCCALVDGPLLVPTWLFLDTEGLQKARDSAASMGRLTLSSFEAVGFTSELIKSLAQGLAITGKGTFHPNEADKLNESRVRGSSGCLGLLVAMVALFCFCVGLLNMA